MTKEKFWQLIEYSRGDFDPARFNGNMKRQLKLMEEALRLLPVKELEDYESIFHGYYGRAYTHDHWLAAYLIEGGCSDDGFADFRAWMISMGEKPFRAMIAHADNVADYATAPGVECASFESFHGLACKIYEEKTGDTFPESCYKTKHPSKPTGRNWKADDYEYFQSAFPKSWEKRYRSKKSLKP